MEWLLYARIVYKRKLKKRKKIENHQKRISLESHHNAFSHKSFYVNPKCHGFGSRKSTSAESIHTLTKYTKNEREKADFPFPFSWFCSHTHKHNYRIPKRNLFNALQCFFRDNTDSSSSSLRKWYYRIFFLHCGFHFWVLHLIFIPPAVATHAYDFTDFSAFFRFKTKNRKIIEWMTFTKKACHYGISIQWICLTGQCIEANNRMLDFFFCIHVLGSKTKNIDY